MFSQTTATAESDNLKNEKRRGKNLPLFIAEIYSVFKIYLHNWIVCDMLRILPIINKKIGDFFIYLYIDKKNKKMYNTHVRAMASSYIIENTVDFRAGCMFFVLALETEYV